MFDVQKPIPWSDGTVLPRPDKKIAFQGSSWSPDGKQLAGSGVLLSDITSVPTGGGVLVYSIESKQYLVLKDIIPDMRQSVVRDKIEWLNDGRRLLSINGGRIFLIDVQARKARMLYDSPGLYWLSLSKDDHWIYVTEQADEGDIWLATLK